MEIAAFVPAAFAGYYTLNAVTHPQKSKIRQKMPRIKMKKMEFAPQIKLHLANRTITFHHWFNFSILLVASAFVANGFLDSALTRGFLVGGILQGLQFADRKMIHKHNIN